MSLASITLMTPSWDKHFTRSRWDDGIDPYLRIPDWQWIFRLLHACDLQEEACCSKVFCGKDNTSSVQPLQEILRGSLTFLMKQEFALEHPFQDFIVLSWIEFFKKKKASFGIWLFGRKNQQCLQMSYCLTIKCAVVTSYWLMSCGGAWYLA